MPSHSVKQAKTMSAIAHGWRPSGSAAKIPVSVAKEFHAADSAKKYGGKHKGTAGPKVAAKYKAQYHGYKAHGGGIAPIGIRIFTSDRDHPMADPHVSMPQQPDPSYGGSRPQGGHLHGTGGGHYVGYGHHSKHHAHVQPHTFRGVRGRRGA